MKKIMIGLSLLGLLVALFGIKLFDITIFESQSLKSNVKKALDAQTSFKKQLPKSNVEEEPETQILPQQTRDDEVVQMPLSTLMKALKSLPLSSDKLEFIEENIKFMPDRLSSDELHHILAQFYRFDNKLEVIETCLPRLPDRLSLDELNRILNLFYRESDKLKITKLFRSRLEDNYSDSEFERFKKHYLPGAQRREAINLLFTDKR